MRNTIIRMDNLDKGIKTYRLYEKEMYNIDLEDKEGYVEEFGKMRTESKDG